MSTELGKVKSIENPDQYSNPKDIFVTSFWGGNVNKSCIQLTIGGTSYCQLDKKGIKKLRKLLKQKK